MANLQEIARLTREELLTLIRPVLLVSLNPSTADGSVSGRFRSGDMLFDYMIKGGTVSYRPVGAGGARSDAMGGTLEEARSLVAALLSSRRALRHSASPARRDGYESVTARLDAGKNCVTGYSCGSTCIDKNKTCRVKGGGGAQRLAQMVRGGPSRAREQEGRSKAQQQIAALMQRRDGMGRALVETLSRQRPDGMGNYIENPDASTMRMIDNVGRRVKAIDKKLNILEGKDPDEKRWVEGDPYGLSKYSDFQSPGRQAYEKKVLAEELSAGEKGSTAIFMSGGPASGKSTLRQREFGDSKGFVTVDPDALKNYDPVMRAGVALGMKQAAALAHENSSRLSKELLAAAKDQGLNLIMDGTGANAEKYISQMQGMKERGYNVTLLAQHVPEEIGVGRALSRADRTGRYVVPDFIKHAYEVIPGNFERLAAVADRATLNDGQTNQVIMQYEGGRLVGGDRRSTAEYRRRYGKPAG